MAGGPIFPSSAFPADTSGRLFPYFYNGAGGNASPHDEGLGVKASLDADATWELRYLMPPSIPTGTLKLRLLALANATSGAAKVTVKDGVATPAGSPGSSGNPSAASLTSETQTTVTWAASENDRYKLADVTLTAAPSAGDMLVVALTFNTTGWTLAQISVWIPAIVWV